MKRSTAEMCCKKLATKEKIQIESKNNYIATLSSLYGSKYLVKNGLYSLVAQLPAKENGAAQEGSGKGVKQVLNIVSFVKDLRWNRKNYF